MVVMVKKCSLSQLCVEIHNVFVELRDLYPFGQDTVKEIQKALLEGTFVFSPLRLEIFPKDYPKTGFFHTLSVPEFPDFYLGIRSKKEDDLVFMALSRVLCFTFHSYFSFIDHSFGFRKERKVCDFYAEGWKEVEILFHFDLSPALNSIPRSRLLSKLEPLVTDKYVFHLLSAFLALPILDEDGRDWSIDVGIPSSGVLTMVLLNLFLDEFDRAFIRLFPGIRYARYVHEVFVALPMSSSEKVSLEDIQTLLKVQDPRLASKVDFSVGGVTRSRKVSTHSAVKDVISSNDLIQGNETSSMTRPLSLLG